MSDLSISLPDSLIEAVAHRVVEILNEQAPASSSPWLDVNEAAAYIRAKPQRVYDLVHAGRLKPERDGRRLLFHTAHLDAYLRGGK